ICKRSCWFSPQWYRHRALLAYASCKSRTIDDQNSWGVHQAYISLFYANICRHKSSTAPPMRWLHRHRLPSSRKRVGLGGWTAVSGDSRRRNRPICLDRPERLSSSRFDYDKPTQQEPWKFLPRRSRRKVGIAQTQNSQTPKAISREYAWVVLDPSRDQGWTRFPVHTRLAIPIHYYPLSSVAHHSLKVQSRL